MEIINSDLTIEGSLDLQKNLQVNANAFVFGRLEIGGTIKARELEVSEKLVVKGSGVGIGIKKPRRALHLYANIAANGPAPLLIETNWGYMEIGSKNGSYAHFYTDLPRFYFNRELMINSGRISSYKGDLLLCTEGNLKVTIDKNRGYLIMKGHANNNAAKKMLDKLAPHQLMIGGAWDDEIYFYWKDGAGKKRILNLKGKMF